MQIELDNNLEHRMAVVHNQPFYVEQALTYSLDSAERYAQEHGERSLYPTTSREVLAYARCDWLIKQYRHELSGKLTAAEFNVLQNCFQAEVFSPDQFNSIASAVCDDLGIELEEYPETDVAPLINKLRGLSPGERVALADALEQTWYRGMPAGKTPEEFLSELGIELASD